MKHLSIVICCYNSRHRIKPTLKHISLQEGISTSSVEIILVDNNSSDGTIEVAEEYWKELRSSVDFLIVKESLPGLSQARRCGLENSRGKYILFCDDDNWLSKFYVKEAWKIMESNPKIGVLGGIGFPVYEGNKPEWFDRYKKYYALGEQAKSRGEVTFSKGYVYGAGSVIRKSAIDKLFRSGFVQHLSDRSGKALTSGGDNELCYNIAFMNYEIHYSETLKFDHFISSYRLTLDYLKKFRIGQALSYDIIKSYETILFSKGNIRRSKIARRNEFVKFGKECFSLLKLRSKNQIDEAEYIFKFYNLMNIIRWGLFNWNSNIKKEEEIYNFYKKLKTDIPF